MCQTHVSGGRVVYSKRYLSASFELSSRGCFDNPRFGYGDVFAYMYMLFVMVFVAYTSFYVRDTFRSLRQLTLE